MTVKTDSTVATVTSNLTKGTLVRIKGLRNQESLMWNSMTGRICETPCDSDKDKEDARWKILLNHAILRERNVNINDDSTTPRKKSETVTKSNAKIDTSTSESESKSSTDLKSLTEFNIGSVVRFHGLKTIIFNGTIGRISGPIDKESGRYPTYAVEGKKMMKFKPENMELLSSENIMMKNDPKLNLSDVLESFFQLVAIDDKFAALGDPRCPMQRLDSQIWCEQGMIPVVGKLYVNQKDFSLLNFEDIIHKCRHERAIITQEMAMCTTISAGLSFLARYSGAKAVKPKISAPYFDPDLEQPYWSFDFNGKKMKMPPGCYKMFTENGWLTPKKFDKRLYDEFFGPDRKKNDDKIDDLGMRILVLDLDLTGYDFGGVTGHSIEIVRIPENLSSGISDKQIESESNSIDGPRIFRILQSFSRIFSLNDWLNKSSTKKADTGFDSMNYNNRWLTRSEIIQFIDRVKDISFCHASEPKKAKQSLSEVVNDLIPADKVHLTEEFKKRDGFTEGRSLNTYIYEIGSEKNVKRFVDACEEFLFRWHEAIHG